MVSVRLLYRAPFDALITNITALLVPDTKTFWAFGTQNFITYQVSCLVMYNVNPCVTFQSQQRVGEMPQECGFLKWSPYNQGALELADISDIRESKGRAR